MLIPTGFVNARCVCNPYPEGIESFSPGLLALASYPGFLDSTMRTYPERVASIPYVPLVEFDLVASQQFANFVLKRNLEVMYFLVVDVIFDCRDLRKAD